MQKTVFFAFRDNPLCFIHVLLNALDMAEKGMEGKIVLEGEAVTLVPIMAEPGHFLHPLYTKAKAQGLIVGACKACSAKLKVTEAVSKEEIALIGELAGHPAMSDFISQGYTILTF
ncbi:DsrE family protein [Desulfobulbus rhabdoformis]|uniref:DsrE family protein n=1 Tax=Desulfobulbus rhabdoformis TaxID=34032 RepID=UPI001965A132|nr:DsrE family protein [Desulfobulbus rhabdoformis]MBM9613121.1 DsrE family protein [Desulfobulbus rhabdoformis]